MNEILEDLRESILSGDRARLQEQINGAIEAGLDPVVILNDGMVAAMKEVGRLFECGEYFVPEMMRAARAMKDGLAILKPSLQRAALESSGKVIAGTVQGDMHDIGKNLVCMMLEGAGFEIQDLGIDVSPAQFIDAVRASGADILAMSALLSTTVLNMKVTIEALERAGLRDKVKVIVGGASVTESSARQVGADGYAPDASQAVALVQSLIAQ
ncbi:MAG: corrinoid protein [Ardenticatenaceae bacterium]|nr:corrinoid protein [Ardenticatenaceae bacterium]HBY95995.1 cobalamin-binding protein [Chloroflexota bacterium]